MQKTETTVDRAKRLGISIATLARRAEVDGRRLYNAAKLAPDEEARLSRVLDAAEKAALSS